MKPKLLLITLFLTSHFLLLTSQIPQGFNYQAIARDGSGNPITGASMQVKIGILSDTIANIMVWEELFNPVKTNAFGMFNIVVGTGVKQSGSAGTFSAIDWTKTPLFFRTSIYYPGSWKVMGTSKLQSVPYSMVAANLEGTLPYVGVAGNTSTQDSALFVVRNNTGQIVFAVYNEGVRIYVSDTLNSKGRAKGGFAIGSFDKSKGTSQPLFVVGTDSIRAYIDDNGTKAVKGGFAIGSFNTSKTLNQQYLTVNNDSIRMYINDAATKSVKGGFAIGGFNTSKGSNTQYLKVTHDSTRIITADSTKGFGVSNLKSGNPLGYLRLTPLNYFIGHQAGRSITTGLYNSVLGYQSGYALNSGNSNSFIGYKAGYSNTSGNYNVFIGNNSGYFNKGSMNTFIGFISGQYNQTGYYNTFVGDSSGFSNTSGYDNTFLGGRAGCSNSTGYFNIFAGSQAGYRNTTGSYNTAFGTSALYSNSKGSGNVANGTGALYSNTTGIQNTAIGMYALQSDTSGSGNVAVGSWTLGANTSGSWNVAIGGSALFFNTTGSMNVANGCGTLANNTTGSYNVANGYAALENNTIGGENVANGMGALENNTTGSYNVANGYSALTSNKIGSDNVANGYSALISNKTGSDNVAFGGWSLFYDTTGVYNVAIGSGAGFNSKSGSGNVFIGYNAGYNETGSNKLYIANSSTNPPLIYGDFSTGNVGIGTISPGSKLAIAGLTGSATGSALIINGNNVYYLTSKKESKKDIEPLSDNFEKILRAKPVSFKDKATGMKGIGYIAEDFEEEGLQNLLVYEDGKLVSLRYDLISVYNLEVIKEQQKQIESQQKEIDELKTLVNTLVANQSGQGNK
jgi:trimeric autotransporter adhesin